MLSQRPAFHLSWPTPAEWVRRVADDPEALLSDHAHCELKAAASAQGLIARNPRHERLVGLLAALAVEEMQHFEIVVAELYRRGGRLGYVQPNPYAEGLLASSAATRKNLLLDRLLVSSLIEARSLERFYLLSQHLSDPRLVELYRGLIASEASHQGLFLNLAREFFSREQVSERLDVLRTLEGEIVSRLPFDVRMHSGLCDA